jgi:hypothetical protein
MTATGPGRSLAERQAAVIPTSRRGDLVVSPVAVCPADTTARGRDRQAPPGVLLAREEPPVVSFELSGAPSGALVYPPNRARPYWRDDHGHRFILDQVLAGEPQQQRERMLGNHANAILDVALALASARLADQHTQVSALAHAASRLCNEMGGRVAPDYWQPGR